MINSNLPPGFTNNHSAFAPPGKLTVGEEGRELRDTPLKAVEEAGESGRLENRRDPGERPAEADQQQRLRQRREEEQAGERAARDRQLERDQQEIRELSARDREVRAHEQAHASVGGQYAGAPQYTYQRGPDGISYAVAGEVSIDTGGVPGDPLATIAKAQQVQRAALAPIDPSPQDRRVAAEAAQMQLSAQVELRELQQQETRLKEERLAAAQEGSAGQENGEAGGLDGAAANEAGTDPVAASGSPDMDINRRLVDIGLREPDNPTGALLNEVV